jgi:hypothetical protein
MDNIVGIVKEDIYTLDINKLSYILKTDSLYSTLSYIDNITTNDYKNCFVVYIKAGTVMTFCYWTYNWQITTITNNNLPISKSIPYQTGLQLLDITKKDLEKIQKHSDQQYIPTQEFIDRLNQPPYLENNNR